MHALEAAAQFAVSEVLGVRSHGSGNVHRTHLVTQAAGPPFLLQHVNTAVFPRPDLLQRNLRMLAAHMVRHLAEAPGRVLGRWEVPEPLAARGGFGDLWSAPDGSVWRAQRLIERTRPAETLRDEPEAREVGRALGTFHALTADLPAASLADPLPGFHVTPLYLARFDEVLAGAAPARRADAEPCLGVVEAHRAVADILEKARRQGCVQERPVHGDPKVDNVLLDDATGRAVALVDLDTVKPGLLPWDLGDCLRSACNPLGEETAQLQEVRFDPRLCRALLAGYRSAAGGSISSESRDLVFDAARLLAFELGLRFLTDHLAGDVYFRIRRAGQNLARALVQFRLLESIEEQEGEIRAAAEER